MQNFTLCPHVLRRLGIVTTLLSLGLWLTVALAQAAPLRGVAAHPSIQPFVTVSSAQAQPRALGARATSNQYLITVWPTTNGVITPDTQLVAPGATITFTILPNSGYHIADVIVDRASQGALSAYTFANVTAPHSISAAFAINIYTITPTVLGSGGRILPSGPQTVTHSTTLAFSIVPDPHHHITGVWVDGIYQGLISNYVFADVAAHHILSATFTEDTFVLVPIAFPPGGSLTPGIPQTVVYGASRTFFITPSVGYTIADVGIDGLSVGVITRYTFSNITANHFITAAFTPRSYHLVPVAASVGGSISPSVPITASYGTTHTFYINPDVGHHIAQVSVDGTGLLVPVAVYTFANVNSDHILSATFAVNTYTLTPLPGVNGVISPNIPQTVAYGGNRNFLILPNPNHHIENVWVDGVAIGPRDSYTFTNVMANHTLSAAFSLNGPMSLTLTVSNTNNVQGYVIYPGNPNCYTICATTHAYSSTLVLTASVSSGRFMGWGGDCSGLNITCSLLMTAPRNVTAYFGFHRIYMPFVWIAPPCLTSSFEIEPNNSPTEATGLLCSGQTYQGHPNDSFDWFYFDTPAAGPITVTISNNTATGQQLQLLDANHTLLGFVSGSSNLQIACANVVTPTCTPGTPFPAGRYYVFVYSNGGFNTLPYSLRVTYPSPVAP